MADQNMENTQTQAQPGGAQQGTGADQQPDQGQQTEKLFTQADVDRIVGNRLSRMRQDMENTETYRRERDEARRELEQLKNNAFLKDQGVPEHFRDYVTFRASQNMNNNTDFQQAVKNFLSQNPTYASRGFRVVSTGGSNLSNGSGNSGVNDAEIRKAMGLKG